MSQRGLILYEVNILQQYSCAKILLILIEYGSRDGGLLLVFFEQDASWCLSTFDLRLYALSSQSQGVENDLS